MFIWYKSFYKNYYFIVFGILFLHFIPVFDFFYDFLDTIVFYNIVVGRGVIDDSLYFFWFNLPGDFVGDVWFERVVIDDLYFKGMSILKLNI